jgi:NAD(P)H dehydrogenase (quinone)
MTPRSTSADRGLCGTAVGGGGAGPHLSSLNEGFPAILKGFFDRVFIPGVSFTIGPDGGPVPNPQKLRKLAAVCTYGANRTTTFLLGDPPKLVVKRLVRAMPGHAVRCDYLAYYDMGHSTAEKRTASWRRLSEHSRN